MGVTAAGSEGHVWAAVSLSIILPPANNDFNDWLEKKVSNIYDDIDLYWEEDWKSLVRTNSYTQN